MNYGEMVEAVDDAENTMRLADMLANKVARLLVGRLRKVESCYVLNQLKRELRDYNINTGQWK